MKCNEKCELLKVIYLSSFAVDELQLYLDTHPCDKKAQQYFCKYSNMRREALQEYTKYYGPLEEDNINLSEGVWTWIDCPWPWQ